MADIKIIQSGNLVEVYEYENDFFDDFNDLFAWDLVRDTRTNLERIRQSVSRSRNRIKRLIEANVRAYNGFKPVLVTYTFAENVTSLPVANKVFRLYTQRLHRYFTKLGYSSLKYISIVEFQKRGAVHYHVIYFNLPFVDGIKDIIAGIWKVGFIQVKGVRHIDRISSYLTKYLTKSLTDKRLRGKKAYSSSRNLYKPIETLYSNLLSTYSLDKHFSNYILSKTWSKDYQVGYHGRVKYTSYQLT